MVALSKNEAVPSSLCHFRLMIQIDFSPGQCCRSDDAFFPSLSVGRPPSISARLASPLSVERGFYVVDWRFIHALRARQQLSPLLARHQY